MNLKKTLIISITTIVLLLVIPIFVFIQTAMYGGMQNIRDSINQSNREGREYLDKGVEVQNYEKRQVAIDAVQSFNDAVVANDKNLIQKKLTENAYKTNLDTINSSHLDQFTTFDQEITYINELEGNLYLVGKTTIIKPLINSTDQPIRYKLVTVGDELKIDETNLFVSLDPNRAYAGDPFFDPIFTNTQYVISYVIWALIIISGFIIFQYYRKKNVMIRS
jgi:hypothetical protein